MFKDGWFYETYLGASIALEVKEHLYTGKSKYQKIDVFQTDTVGKVLLLDDILMTTDKDEFYYHESIAHISMSMHPNPKKVMVIGGGDGGTAREALRYKAVEEVEMVEIDEEVINVSKKYFPIIASELENPKLKIKVEDAIEYVKNAKENYYDAILCDSTDPEGFAAGLISKEFYTNASKALKEDGIYISQSGSIVLQEKEFKTALENMRSAFKYVDAAISVIPCYPCTVWAFLIGSNKPIDRKVKSIPSGKLKYWSPELQEKLFIKPVWLQEKYFDLQKVG